MEKDDYKEVYQFKISLKNISPPIWRRIQVPENYSFWDLHVAIQNAMGWLDCHLHEFTTIEKDYKKIQRIGVPDIEMDDFEVLPSWKEKINNWFSLDNNKAINYTYDFGDNWEHRVELEKILKRKEGVDYPICITGKRACPPEDCGGVWGYENTINILKNPKKPEYKETLEWLGGDFFPEKFDCSEVFFEDPDERIKERDEVKNFVEPVNNLPKKENNQDIEWEIAYFQLKYYLKDEQGNKIKPIMLLIVHPESYFIIDSHLFTPNEDYLKKIIDRVLDLLRNNSFSVKKITVKNKDLFNILKSLKILGLEVENTTKTKALNVVKKDMQKFMDSPKTV
jgi:hypothetical protein